MVNVLVTSEKIVPEWFFLSIFGMLGVGVGACGVLA